MAVPKRAAKAMVASRDRVSWVIVRRSADCGVVVAEPMPRVVRTAREERREAMEETKAWRESWVGGG